MHYISLHNHSTYSFYSGVCTVRELVQRAVTLNMPAIALTDTNRMSGLITFYCTCKELGIKPILGVELTEPESTTTGPSIVVLAKNAEGYSDICEIITQRHLDTPHFNFKKIFANPWPNLILFTADPDLLTLLAATPNRSNLYGELINTSAQTRLTSRALEETALRLSVPLMVSTNAFFLEQTDFETHKTLTAIGLNSTLSRLKPHEYAPQRAIVQSHDAMAALFPGHAVAIANTWAIADACTVQLPTGSWIMPTITVPDGQTPATMLREFALDGLDKNYGAGPHFLKARAIQDMELEVIEKLGYPSYFLIVKDIRDWANATFGKGYRKPVDCTILRGSAANSLTFYNIGVSSLDPIRHDLYFQRFLNEDRASPPDADLDFGWDEREQALEYMAQRWGRDRVAITCTTNHFRRRAAFRETAKVFGFSEEQITTILTSRKTRTQKIDDDEVRHILARAEQIRGKPRFLGQHPGGVIVTNQPIRRHVACEYAGSEQKRIITQIDMHSGIDELGLIKFDLLGNGSISVLRDTLHQLADQGLPDPGVADVDRCAADPAVQTLIRNGRTRGIFYIESPAQMRLNKKAQAESFEEIAITSSLVRPAGTRYISLFVKRHREYKQGVQTWEFLHPSLKPILEATHDVCAYQEDVTKICHQVAGLTYKKADVIRKMMNSLHEGVLGSDQYAQTSREFIEGCKNHSGLSDAQALELWERVSSFTGFSFCKSHSASYAQLSFKCTYLKAHYPAQFLAAVISNNHGFYTRDVYLDEARRFGIRILSVDINESDIAYYGKHTWLRVGFMHIRQLSSTGMQNIVRERRENGPFKNLIDFVRRVDLTRKEIEHLILTGAFNGFGLSQPESLFLLDDIHATMQPDLPQLFSNATLFTRKQLHPGLTDYTLAQRCFNELHLLGFMVSGNILDILDMHPASKNAVPACSICDHVGKRIKMFGWPITNRLHLVRAERPMMFLTIEDKTECCDVILWPDVYERFGDVVALQGPFEIWGTVREDWGTFALAADTLRAVEWSPSIVDFERASQRLFNSFKSEDYPYADINRSIIAA